MNMDYKQMYKRKKQLDSRCIFCIILSLATAKKKKATSTTQVHEIMQVSLGEIMETLHNILF